jgi:hydroxymethylpyrimidine pyrophosphatase-like HAD family hydrolase
MTEKLSILATDLDGTFLGGDGVARARLYDWIAQHRAQIVLIFVSGRGQRFMRELAESLPVRPDHCIGDVGTTVHVGAALAPHPHIEPWLDAHWPADAPARIEAVLANHKGLRLQPGIEGRRRSYFFQDPAIAHTAAVQVRGAGFEPLISDNLYFDVLPRGLQKGPTLLRLLDTLGLPRERTLVAGDTLNDLSMFQTGLPAVAVANRELALDAALSQLPHVHRSAFEGAAGVLDALARFHHQGA